MRTTIAAAFLLAGMAIAEASGPAELAWQNEILKANEAYAGRPTAILKIDDAIYLEPGQQAWLIAAPAGQQGQRWTMTKPEAAAAEMAFAPDMKTARLTAGTDQVDLLADGVSPHALSATTRAAAAITQMEPGKDGLRLMIYNDANPDAAAFKGLDYFPYDASFVVEARIEPDAAMTPKVFQTSRGWYKQFYHAGDAVFTLKGVETRLPLYAGSNKPAEIDSLAAFIMDDTTGTETYGVGRYIDIAVTPGTTPTAVTIDFNYLYNPNCARSPHYNCPVAVDRVRVPIRAGEKKPAHHS